MKISIWNPQIWMILAAAIAMPGAVLWAGEVETPTVYPTAIFPFVERDSSLKGYGEKVSDILFAKLAVFPNVILVERAEIKKLLDELGLGLSGIIRPDQASKIGQLTGAKILLTGSVFEVEKKLYIVAKIIGTETSRVLGRSVTGRTEELGELVDELSGRVAEAIVKDGSELVAREETLNDRIAALNKVLGDAKRPVVLVQVSERHVGQATLDPAAQTELILFLEKTGFEVIDPDGKSTRRADVIIDGEGFSEFALRRDNLISIKARLEVKAVDRATDRVIAVDRQTTVVVDLTEQIAGKKALQEAAADIAERLLPELVKK